MGTFDQYIRTLKSTVGGEYEAKDLLDSIDAAIDAEGTAIREAYNTANNPPALDGSGNLPATVLVRKGTAAQLGAIVLGDGELAVEVDSEGTPVRIRMGDGETAGGLSAGGDFKIGEYTANPVLISEATDFTFFAGIAPTDRPYIGWVINENETSIVLPQSTSAAYEYSVSPGISGGIIPCVAIRTSTGDPTPTEGLIVINTVDNNVKLYADGGWRTLASW